MGRLVGNHGLIREKDRIEDVMARVNGAARWWRALHAPLFVGKINSSSSSF
jgi:hypothetical protein